MSTFVQIVNDSDELVISDRGITYGYLGRAALSVVTQAGGGSITKTPGQSVYTINWAGDIIVALPVKANGTTALRNISKSGNTWTISVHKGNGAFDVNGFDIQEATEVYVFGAPVLVGSFAAALYDDNGDVCADLTRQPLTYRARINIAVGSLSWGMPAGVTIPAIVGTPMDYNVTSVRDGAFYIIRDQGRGWQLVAGNIERNIFQNRWRREDGGVPAVDTIHQISAILIDASGLA